MSAAHRSMPIATAAAALLGALWFVPTAHATTGTAAPRDGGRSAHTTLTALRSSASSGTSSATASGARAGGARLADTGGSDTTPYLIAGTAFLGVGEAFIAYSVRRDHGEYEADPELAGA